MYTKIMVAIDHSHTAQRALTEATVLARSLGATLCIATAVDTGALLQHGMGLGSFIDIDKVKQQLREDSIALLDEAQAKALAAGCPSERQLIESSQRRVAEMISEAASYWGADLIVMGTHGRRGFERMLVGSVAENLVRIASVSLLLVRDQ